MRMGTGEYLPLISHRHTQMDTDFCSADLAEQKESSLREKRNSVVLSVCFCVGPWLI